MTIVFLSLVLLLAAGFTVLNGLRDAASTVAVAVRTRALTPTIAILLAAIFNFIGAALSTGFAASLRDQLFIMRPGVEGLAILLGAFCAALAWGLWQWRIGYPSSSTHALIGGIAGASGAAVLKGHPPLEGLMPMVLTLVVLPLLLSPVIAFVVAYLLVFPVAWLTRYAQHGSVQRKFRQAQAVTTSALALGHGLQDSARIVAVLAFALAAAELPSGTEDGSQLMAWLAIGVGLLLTAGTLLGGWRIAYTLSSKLIRVDPMRGMVSQAVSSVILLVGAIGMHLPLATTQLSTAGITGAGAHQGFARINLWLGGKIFGAWLLTPVACGLGAAVVYLAVSPLL
ncbi:inorganic phosphate transporter [Acaricomes phytoseiuli]|uniref:inorganic phosphate transporter n=1 Tax=Acaricomes phytoseiuli TaxID=291968 RepID=UPI002221846E|nr:inorganic phosphate transporter [Acaricomes phytoseiuli]MCW1249208.1 inorganic phosphate transporter [Acaricomes phytoseiuli]